MPGGPHPSHPKCPRRSLRNFGSISAGVWWQPACPSPAKPPLKKRVLKKVGFKFLHAAYIAKSSETMFSELAVGFENFCWRPEMRPAPRAQGPPRLAAGAGDRNAETRENFYILGRLGQFSRAFSSGSDQRVPRDHHRNASGALGANVKGAADAPAQSSGATSLFPARREVKREVGKAWQAWPGNQTS